MKAVWAIILKIGRMSNGLYLCNLLLGALTVMTRYGAHYDAHYVLDGKECVFLVLLDFSAAFDTMDHGQLKARLEQ